MLKQPIPLNIADISKFSRNVGQQLGGDATAPSHLTLMNIFARAAGFCNFQHLRADHAAQARLATPAEAQVLDHRLVERVLHQFDAQGVLQHWPAKRRVQDVCLWVLWSALPPAKPMHERDVNGVLNLGHAFGDPALLRRSLLSLGIITRDRDGSNYQRLERPPPAEAQAVIAQIKQRRMAAAVRPAKMHWGRVV